MTKETKTATEPQVAAMYARFSSDLQKDRSIDDQLADCQKWAAREGVKTPLTFSDRAKSGASMFDRDGIIDMMRAAKEKKFNTLIVESLDRLSRDQEDLAGIYKRLTFYGVKIQTLNEGVATPIQVGLRGLVGELYLSDLANKVRRGHAGRARAGLSPGGLVYGYRLVLGKAGERELDPDNAKIVQRIFTEFAAGQTPREICLGLTHDNVPTSRGGKVWNRQSLYGILTNQTYTGQLVWGKHRTVLNPDTGRHIKRNGDEADRVTVQAPHLRIIDQALWNAVQARLRERATQKFGPTGKVTRRPSVARTDYLLAGMLRCGVCNHHMQISSTDRNGNTRIGCAAAIQHGTCKHTRTYGLDRLQKAVIDTMRPELVTPEAIAEMAKAFKIRCEELKAQQRKNLGERATTQKKINAIEIRINRLADAIENGGESVKMLLDRIAPLEAERVGLQERLRQIDAESRVELHPNAADNWRSNLKRLYDALNAEETVGPRTLAAFRNIYDTVVVYPVGRNDRYQFKTFLRAEVATSFDLFPPMRSAKQVLEEEGIFNSAADKHGCAFLSAKQRNVICFGHFTERLAA